MKFTTETIKVPELNNMEIDVEYSYNPEDSHKERSIIDSRYETTHTEIEINEIRYKKLIVTDVLYNKEAVWLAIEEKLILIEVSR